jgi:glutamine synthetase adenylyltransferase
MEKVKGKSQFNKRRSDKKVSDVSRVQRNRLRHRMSLAKSIGKLRKGEQETPIIAVQQVHLLKKQKSFLTKQAFVFEKKAETVKEQVKELERKIKLQKELAARLFEELEESNDEETEEDLTQVHRSKPDNTMSQKAKKFFKLGY